MRYNKPKYLYELFEGDEGLLPEAPRAGWVNFFQPKPAGLGLPHRRRWVHEIYFVVGGVLRLTEEGRIVEARAGEALIVRPGAWHAGIGPLNIIEPCELCWFELHLPRLRRCAAVPASERRHLASSIRALQRQAYPIAPETQSRFRQLVNEYRARRSASVVAARHVLLSLLHNLLRDHAAADTTQPALLPGQSAAIQRARELIDSGAHDKIPISTLARLVRLPLPEFYRRFQAETGATPFAYRMRRQMRTAQDLVADATIPISRIAARLGFASSQYFATVFKRMTDSTPSEYRRQCARLSKL